MTDDEGSGDMSNAFCKACAEEQIVGRATSKHVCQRGRIGHVNQLFDVAADEREACAEIAEQWGDTGIEIARLIRARGNE